MYMYRGIQLKPEKNSNQSILSSSANYTVLVFEQGKKYVLEATGLVPFCL